MTLNGGKLRKICFLWGKVKYAIEILHSEQIFIAFVCKKHDSKEKQTKIIKSSGL